MPTAPEPGALLLPVPAPTFPVLPTDPESTEPEPVPLPYTPPAETDPVPSVLADVIESVVDAASLFVLFVLPVPLPPDTLAVS
jgi:hypothetical protein